MSGCEGLLTFTHSLPSTSAASLRIAAIERKDANEQKQGLFNQVIHEPEWDNKKRL